VFQIVDDRQGGLWMTSNRGVFRVSKEALVDLAERRVTAITSTLFGGADGIGQPVRSNAQPPACGRRMARSGSRPSKAP
jgi:hypothetical protein